MTTTALTAGDGGDENRGGGKRARTPSAMVRASGLPEPLAAAVLAVTGKARLWPGERTDVARELCAHFLEGLDTGASAEDLLAGFGDPRTTARLITRARKRGRPWAWRAVVRTGQAVAALVLLVVAWYGWNAARFYSGSPTIRFNVQAEINEPFVPVPLDQRGWPLYRDAARELSDAKFRETIGKIDAWPMIEPGTPEWSAACAATDAVRGSIDKVRRATMKKHSACIVRTLADTALPGGAPDGIEPGAGENPVAVSVLLPQLSIYRSHARLLTFELIRDAHERRAADAAATAEQMLSLAHHAGEDGTLISQLVSLAIGHLTFDAVNRVVRDDPSLFNDGQLRRLAHVIAGYHPYREGREHEPWRPDLTFERRSFEDLLQRFYTDDGDGDGRLCDGALDYFGTMGIVEPRGAKALSPVLAGVVGGRRETREVYDRLMDRAEAESAKPCYLRDFAAIASEVDRETHGIRYSLVATVIPAAGRVGGSFDTLRTLRDATSAGLAIELFYRRNGRYPASWDELVPSFLPAAPADPWSGRPLVFKAGGGATGRPLIYSVGADKKDDGGRTGTPWDVISASSFPSVLTSDGPTDTLDWLIWPKPEPTGPRPAYPPGVPAQPPRNSTFRWGWVGSLMGGS